MNEHPSFSAFPIPVVAEVGAGSQPDDGLEYMNMPKAMDVFRTPILPEPEDMLTHPNALQTLHALIDMVARYMQGNVVPPMTLLHLPETDLTIINQVLGEGEVSATIAGHDELGTQIDIQETVFVGVWRVIAVSQGVRVYDALEVNTIPALLAQVAHQDAQTPHTSAPLPKDLVNVPTIVQEVRAHSTDWQMGKVVHVVNLTLLPLTDVDIAYIDDQLGTGRITILSRGYGNCRIVNTRTANTWRLVYYNSQDKVILNCIEITGVPEVACAAEQDFEDTHERLIEVLAWLESGT